MADYIEELRTYFSGKDWKPQLNKIKDRKFKKLEFGNVFRKVHAIEKTLGNEVHKNFSIIGLNKEIEKINDRINEVFKKIEKTNVFVQSYANKFVFQLNKLKVGYDFVNNYFQLPVSEQNKLIAKFEISKEIGEIKEFIKKNTDTGKFFLAITDSFGPKLFDINKDPDAPYHKISNFFRGLRWDPTFDNSVFKNPKEEFKRVTKEIEKKQKIKINGTDVDNFSDYVRELLKPFDKYLLEADEQFNNVEIKTQKIIKEFNEEIVQILKALESIQTKIKASAARNSKIQIGEHRGAGVSRKPTSQEQEFAGTLVDALASEKLTGRKEEKAEELVAQQVAALNLAPSKIGAMVRSGNTQKLVSFWETVTKSPKTTNTVIRELRSKFKIGK